MGRWDQYITRYVAISQDVAQYLTAHFHIPQEKVCVIYNGVDIAEALEGVEEKISRADWGLRAEDYVFLNVAAISPAKGQIALLEALRHIAQTHPRVKVLCVGHVLDEEYFQRLLRKRSLYHLEDRLIFAGFHPNVHPFYRLADAFILPSVLEGFGVAKLEAMIHGLPLILTRVGDSDKLIENSDVGLLIPNTYGDLYSLGFANVMTHLNEEMPANATDLAAAMAEFVVHKEHWQKAGQQGREKVLRHFTKARALKEYEALLLGEIVRDQRKRISQQEQGTGRYLRSQLTLLQQLLEEKERVLQEKERVLQEKEQRLTELSCRMEQQRAEIVHLRQTVDLYLQELQRLSLTIFDRLDLTKRIRAVRARLFWHLRRRLPPSVKRVVKPLFSQVQDLQPGRAERIQTQQEHAAAQLQEILAQHETARDVIIFAPSVDWNLPLFQRPHQLALAFARSGCLVFFCEPPHSGAYAQGFHAITPGLYVANVPIASFQVIASPLVFVLSYNVFDIACLDRARCVYDYIDELDVFPGERQVLEQHHHHLLRTATLVLATAERLWQQVKDVRQDALLCPNGVDYHFIRRTIATTSHPPDDLVPALQSAACVIGYYGALADWFDYELVMRAATARPEYAFVLIGPNYDGSLGKSQIRNVKNIFWLGPRPYAELPRYLKYFDVATIPFKLNEITHSTSPIKLFEYMAGGKPVVTTAMHESSRFAGVLVAETPEDYVDKLDEALKLRTDPEYLNIIDRVAQENTWDARAQQILTATSLINGRGRLSLRQQQKAAVEEGADMVGETDARKTGHEGREP
jgi:glycosyltransferase involved in cell wall biosynthesis